MYRFTRQEIQLASISISMYLTGALVEVQFQLSLKTGMMHVYSIHAFWNVMPCAYLSLTPLTLVTDINLYLVPTEVEIALNTMS